MVSTASAADPLVMMLQVVVAAARQMTNTTASKAQGTTVMMLGSRGCRGGYDGRVPTKGDRFQPGNGQFDCDEAYRYDDHRFHQLPGGRQEAGTFRTGVPRHGSIDAIVRPTQLQHCGCPSAAGGWRVPVGSIVEQTWLGISSFTVAAECVEIFLVPENLLQS